MQIILFIIFLIPALVFADLPCDSGLTKKIKQIDENPPAYQLEMYGFNFKVGSSNESVEGPIDREAVKRLFTTCAPGIIKCLKKKKRRKILGELLATLDFESIEKNLKISGAHFSSQDKEKSGFYACAEEILIRQNFAIPFKDGKAKIKIPFTVTPTCGPVPQDLQFDESCSTQKKVTDLEIRPKTASLESKSEQPQVSEIKPSNFSGLFAFTFWSDGSNKKNDLVVSCFLVNSKMLERLNSYDNCNRKSKMTKALAECSRADGAQIYFFQKRGECEKAQKLKGTPEDL